MYVKTLMKLKPLTASQNDSHVIKVGSPNRVQIMEV